jgi:iron-sulfur cluster repair protein YtfE (RIC family)
MDSIQNNSSFRSDIAYTPSINDIELLKRITEQHEEILQKLMPEIDMHFAAVWKNTPQDELEKIARSYQSFQKFTRLLKDHIYFEETFLLPKLKNKQKISTELVGFINKHDSFEAMIQNILIEIEYNLLPLRELLSFRILLLKMNRLVVLLDDHHTLEDLIFSELTADI